jgi:hypothetical protein
MQYSAEDRRPTDDWVSLPPQFQVFDNDLVIGAAS